MNKKLFFKFGVGLFSHLIYVNVNAASCGPVPLGGVMDAECKLKTAPPPISYFQETKNLIELLKTEQIYFIGSNQDSMKWSGEIFWYGDATCFRSEEKSEMSGTATIKASSCTKEIKDRSKLKYATIKTVSDLKKRFQSCLKEKDISCLRSMTDRNVQVSFGVEPPGDHAFQLYSKWKAPDFKKMENLLEQGLNCVSEDKCEFPKKVSNEGTGLRGGFEKADDRWLLKYYLAGD